MESGTFCKSARRPSSVSMPVTEPGPRARVPWSRWAAAGIPRRRRRCVGRVPEPGEHRERRRGPQRGGDARVRAGRVRLLTVSDMREYYGEVASLELLNRLVAAPLPAGLRAGPVQTLFHRDAYFDAAHWTLRRRGAACRFRTRMDDRRLLTLQVPPGPGSAGGPRGRVEAQMVRV